MTEPQNGCSAVAAAAGDKQESDEDPDPVVIEYSAQTVVHSEPPTFHQLSPGAIPASHYHCMSFADECERTGKIFVGIPDVDREAGRRGTG